MANKFSTDKEDIPTTTQVTGTEPWTIIRHQAVLELTMRERRLGNFGVALYVISQAIPYFVLMNVRWMMAGDYIPGNVNHWLGLWTTIFLMAGIPFAWVGVRATRVGRIARLQWSFTASVVLGIAAIVTSIIPLRVHAWDILSHYGSIYVVCLGVAAFYTAVTVIVVLGVVFRAGAGVIGPRTSFGPHSAAVVWTFNAIAWFALYVTLYLV